MAKFPWWILVQMMMNQPKPIAPVTRDDASDEINAQDDLRRRKGGAADILNGRSGSEPAGVTIGKLKLGN